LNQFSTLNAVVATAQPFSEAASRLSYSSDSKQHAIFTVSLETQQLFFSTIQPISVCEVFISSRSSIVRGIVLCLHTGLRSSQHVTNSGCLPM